MALQIRNLTHARILPDSHLVVRVAMSASQFFVVFGAPNYSANLGSGINRIQEVASGSVPKTNVTVLTASTSGQSSRLPGAKATALTAA